MTNHEILDRPWNKTDLSDRIVYYPPGLTSRAGRLTDDSRAGRSCMTGEADMQQSLLSSNVSVRKNLNKHDHFWH